MFSDLVRNFFGVCLESCSDRGVGDTFAPSMQSDSVHDGTMHVDHIDTHAAGGDPVCIYACVCVYVCICVCVCVDHFDAHAAGGDLL